MPDKCMRGALYNGSCCKAGWWSAPSIHWVNEVKYWKSLSVFYSIREQGVKNFTCSILEVWSYFYVYDAFFFLPVHGKRCLRWHAVFPAMNQITKQLWSNIIIYYILNANSCRLIGNRADDTGLDSPCPLSLYIEMTYFSLRCQLLNVNSDMNSEKLRKYK